MCVFCCCSYCAVSFFVFCFSTFIKFPFNHIVEFFWTYSCFFGNQQVDGRGKLKYKDVAAYLQRVNLGQCTWEMGPLLVSYSYITNCYT